MCGSGWERRERSWYRKHCNQNILYFKNLFSILKTHISRKKKSLSVIEYLRVSVPHLPPHATHTHTQWELMPDTDLCES